MDGIRAPIQNNQPENPSTAQRQTPSRQKISVMTAAFMIGVALLFDGAQAASEALFGLSMFLMPLGIMSGMVIDIIAWLTFLVWLYSRRLHMMKRGGAAGILKGQEPFVIIAAAFGIEIIPVINALPGWSAAIATIIIRERISRLAQAAGPEVVSSQLKKLTRTAEQAP